MSKKAPHEPKDQLDRETTEESSESSATATEESITEQLSAMLEDPEAVKAAAGKAAEVVADMIRKYPYRSVGVSFAAGLLTGVFFGKKSSE